MSDRPVRSPAERVPGIQRSSIVLAASGLALGYLAVTDYLARGYGLLPLGAWIGSNVCLFLSFRRSTRASAAHGVGLDRTDRRLILVLLAMAAPAYLLFTHELPVQVSSDEIAISQVAESTSEQPALDIFSVSGYFQFPSLEFILYGLAGRLAGGINLQNMRLIHALVGLSTVPLTFILLRTVLSGSQAFAGALLLGFNHALIVISRMAMRNDSALVLELIALTLLLRGMQSGRSDYSYLGGAVAGLAFYFYAPGRMTIFIWLASVLLVVINRRWRKALAPHPWQLAASLIAALAAAAPLAASTVQTAGNPDFFDYQRKQLLWTPEGMALQQDWMDARSLAEGVRINIRQGLTAFNSRLHDHGYIYFNPGRGFIDPLSGVLVWLGLAYGLSQARRRADPATLMAPGLLLPWLAFSFVTIKSPNYTRMLITLPFVSYFTVRGLSFLAGKLGGLLERRRDRTAGIRLSRLLTVGFIGVIVGWNLFAVRAYLLEGLRRGDDVGSTVQYIAARAENKSHAFFFASDDEYPFSPNASDIPTWRWIEWMEFLVAADHIMEAFPPMALDRFNSEPPFTIFMNSELWSHSAADLTHLYPDRQVHTILTDGSILAIEVPSLSDDE